jgi:hypothetical protein
MKLAVRVRPGARQERVGGRWDGPRGPALVVAVRARSVDGKANAAVLEAVAAVFGLPKAVVELVSGHRGRDKVLELDGDATAVDARLAELLAR